MGAQRDVRARRWVAAPERVGDLVRGQDPVRREQQQPQKFALFAATQGEWLVTVDAHRDRAEDAENRPPAHRAAPPAFTR
ncbi:hypothetical protein ABQE93_13155 [Mycolicibacterium sp. XJ662]